MRLVSLPLHFSLDPEQKDQLIEVIEKLLADKTTVSQMHLGCSMVLIELVLTDLVPPCIFNQASCCCGFSW